MNYTDDEKLMEMLDALILGMETETSAIVEHLFLNHWNEQIAGKQEMVIMTLASWVREYKETRLEHSPQVSFQVALGKVMQQPAVQSLMAEMSQEAFRRKFE